MRVNRFCVNMKIKVRTVDPALLSEFWLRLAIITRKLLPNNVRLVQLPSRCQVYKTPFQSANLRDLEGSGTRIAASGNLKL